MKPLKYADEALDMFTKLLKVAGTKDRMQQVEDAFGFKQYGILDALKSAPRFMMPDAGLYFENKQEALKVDDEILHLPYPEIILEYAFPKTLHDLSDPKSPEGGGYCTKRIVIVREHTAGADDMGKGGVEFSGIMILPVLYFDDMGKWITTDGFSMIPRTEGHTDEVMGAHCMYTKHHQVPLIALKSSKLLFEQKGLGYALYCGEP